MLICGGSIEESEGTGSKEESEGAGSLTLEESEGTCSLRRAGDSEATEGSEVSEETFGLFAGKEFSRGVGSSEGVLLSRFRSGSEPTIDIVETAGSDKESGAETGEGVEAMDGEVSGDV